MKDEQETSPPPPLSPSLLSPILPFLFSLLSPASSSPPFPSSPLPFPSSPLPFPSPLPSSSLSPLPFFFPVSGFLLSPLPLLLPTPPPPPLPLSSLLSPASSSPFFSFFYSPSLPYLLSSPSIPINCILATTDIPLSIPCHLQKASFVQ